MMRQTGTAMSLAAALMGGAAPVHALAGGASIAVAPRPAASGGLLEDLVRKGLAVLAVAFTNAGAAIVTNRISQSGTAPKNIGWGTGTTTAAVAQTALVTEAAPTTAGGRTVGTESRVTTTQTNDTYRVTGTVTAVSTLTIAEAGLFDATSAGNMLMRGDFTGVAVVSGDSIAFTFDLKFVPSAA